MKRYSQGGDLILLKQLCKYFRLDARELSHIQKVQIMYIYNYLSVRLGNDLEIIIAEIDRLRVLLHIRGRRKCLFYVFSYCQARHMKQHGDYDTKTSRPPSYMPEHHNYA